MAKETVLDDGADIYQRRIQKSEKQKFSELHGRDKWQYFKDYYFTKLVVIIIAIAFIGYFFYTILAPKPETVLHVAVANFAFPESQVTKVQDEFGEYLNIDTENEEIYFDTSYTLSESDYTSAERIATYIYAGELDVFIAPESQFRNYAVSGMFSPLSDQLPTDLYSFLSDSFFSSALRVEDEETADNATGPVSVYGIYLDEIPLFSQYGTFEDRPVLGIVASSTHNENAVEFIRYLFEQ